MQRLAPIILCLLFLSCGKTTNRFEKKDSLQNGELQGFYRAKLEAINTRWRRVFGRASFYLQGVQFYSKVNFHSGWGATLHLQAVHEGSRCPSTADDINQDGIVDFNEALKVSGRMLIPLDRDLKSQESAFNQAPVSNKKGHYLYSNAVSINLLLNDLKKNPTTRPSHLAKLGLKEKLNISNRVVIIYGVPSKIKLPSSFSTIKGFPPHMTVPLACGVINETSERFP
jgi:hypothetical protein